jgi:hypothetical protein
MIIDWSDDSRNALDSIRINREFDTNPSEWSEEQEKNMIIQEFQHPWNLVHSSDDFQKP